MKKLYLVCVLIVVFAMCGSLCSCGLVKGIVHMAMPSDDASVDNDGNDDNDSNDGKSAKDRLIERVEGFFADDGRSHTDEGCSMERIVELLDAIAAKDADAVRELFSREALLNADDFEGTTERLFELFSGDVVSWERYSFNSASASDYGQKSMCYHAWYTVETTTNTYRVFIWDYYLDNRNVDHEGVRTICISDAGDDVWYGLDKSVLGLIVASGTENAIWGEHAPAPVWRPK